MNFLESLLVSSILGGTALIPFVDFIAKDVKSSRMTYVIAFVSSIVIGGVVAFLNGNTLLTTDPTTWFLSSLTVLSTSQTIFNLYWKQSLLRFKFNQKIGATTATPAPEQGTAVQSQDATQG